MASTLQQTYSGKRVLVTGHTGFKGAWLSLWLNKLGAKVAGYSDHVPTQPALFEALKLGGHLQDHRADIRDYPKLKQVFDEFKPEMVFHLAAQPLVRASYDLPKETFDVNIGGTTNVLEAIRQSSTCVVGVIVTTDKTYENVEQDVPFKESDRLGGRDPYSASKAGAEIVFHSYVRSFFPHGSSGYAGERGSSEDSPKFARPTRLASARAGNVIGGGDWAQDRLIPDCVRSWAKKEKVILRNPSSSRPWQHVMDPLYGYLRLGEELARNNPKVVGESFNFGPLHGESATVSEVVEEMAKNWSGAQWEIAQGADAHKHEAKFLRLDCSKADQILGWRQKLKFAQMTRETAHWYSHYYNQSSDILNFTLGQINDFEKLPG